MQIYINCNRVRLCIIAFLEDSIRYIINWELIHDKPVRTTTEALRRAMQAFQSAVHELRINHIDPWSMKAYPPPQNGKWKDFGGHSTVRGQFTRCGDSCADHPRIQQQFTSQGARNDSCEKACHDAYVDRGSHR